MAKKKEKLTDYNQFHDLVYTKPNEKHYARLDLQSSPYLTYQCKCGYMGVIFGPNFNFYECRKCHKKYVLNVFIETTEVTKEMLQFLETTGRDKFVMAP